MFFSNYRRTLIYAFVYGYYHVENNHKVIFEENRTNLENATEVLSELLKRIMTEADIKDLKIKVCNLVISWWFIYRISSYSFRGNYSFLNLTLCTVTFVHSTYRCGNYSREETIQGRKLFAEIRYVVSFLGHQLLFQILRFFITMGTLKCVYSCLSRDIRANQLEHTLLRVPISRL